MMPLAASLEQLAAATNAAGNKPPHWKYRSVAELVLTEGQVWEPQQLPADAADWKGAPNQCYANAAQAVLGTQEREALSEARYVEGFFRDQVVDGIPFAHAWCVDADGRVLELTLNEPGAEYQGIEISSDLLSKTLLQRGSYGVLDNWNNGFPFLVGGNNACQ
jgi:hypothetical protein